jgi:hypothetical protein
VGEALPVPDRLLLLLSLPVAEELAPTVTEPVGEADSVLLPLTVELGVACAVPVAL